METFVTLTKLLENPDAREKARNCFKSMADRHRDENVYSKIDSQIITCWRPMRKDGNLLALNDSRYAQVSIRKKSEGYIEWSHVIYLHQLAWWSKSDFDTSEIELLKVFSACADPQTVSHLCKNSWCFNPEHLVVEPLWVNIYRSSCFERRQIALIKHLLEADKSSELACECQCHQGRKGDPNTFERCID